MKYAEHIAEAAKAAPPVAVTGLTLFGIPLQEWILMGTGLYTLFLIIDKLPVVIDRFTAFGRWIKEKFNGSK